MEWEEEMGGISVERRAWSEALGPPMESKRGLFEDNHYL